MGHLTDAQGGKDGPYLPLSVVMALGVVGSLAERAGSFPRRIRGAVLWPRGQGPPHLHQHQEPGPLRQETRLLVCPG
jgi:hypothetical protein